MAWYPRATKRPIPEANTQPDIRPRGIVLHTAVSNSSSLWKFWTSAGSNGVESHFYIQKEGTAEQYVGTETRADCQVDGNPYCISVEAWDGAGVLWTRDPDVPAYNTAQVNWLVAFLVWAHDTHRIPLRMMKFMGDSGIGYHRQFVGPRPSFATKPRACPGNRKVAQIPGIVARAAKVVADRNKPTPPEDEVLPADRTAIANDVVAAMKTWFSDKREGGGYDTLVDASLDALRAEFREYPPGTGVPAGLEGERQREPVTILHALFRADAASRELLNMAKDDDVTIGDKDVPTPLFVSKARKGNGDQPKPL